MTAAIYISNRAASRRMAQRFAEDVADGLLSEANLAADHAGRLIATLRGAGCGTLSLGALKDALADCFADCQATINNTLDAESVEPDGRHLIDLSEIEKRHLP